MKNIDQKSGEPHDSLLCVRISDLVKPHKIMDWMQFIFKNQFFILFHVSSVVPFFVPLLVVYICSLYWGFLRGGVCRILCM